MMSEGCALVSSFVHFWVESLNSKSMVQSVSSIEDNLKERDLKEDWGNE